MPVSLADLRPRIETVEVAGAELAVYPLRLGDLADLIQAHPQLTSAFRAKKAERGRAIVGVILGAGRKVVADVIDAATRSEPGTAAAAFLSGIDEARIVARAIDISLPTADLEKLLAEAGALLERLGLTAGDQPKAD